MCSRWVTLLFDRIGQRINLIRRSRKTCSFNRSVRSVATGTTGSASSGPEEGNSEGVATGTTSSASSGPDQRRAIQKIWLQGPQALLHQDQTRGGQFRRCGYRDHKLCFIKTRPEEGNSEGVATGTTGSASSGPDQRRAIQKVWLQGPQALLHQDQTRGGQFRRCGYRDHRLCFIRTRPEEGNSEGVATGTTGSASSGPEEGNSPKSSMS